MSQTEGEKNWETEILSMFKNIKKIFHQHLVEVNKFVDKALKYGLLNNNFKYKEDIQSLHDEIFINVYKKEAALNLIKALVESGNAFLARLLRSYPLLFHSLRLVIIDNTGETTHLDSDKEEVEELIRKLFSEFDFHIDICINLTKGQMVNKLKEHSKKDASEEDVFVLFLLCCGSFNGVLDRNEKELSYKDIHNIFKNSPQLKEKPKLFYINVKIKPTDTTENSYGISELTGPDIFVMFNKYTNEPSRFIESLVKVYQENVEKCIVHDLVARINFEQSLNKTNEKAVAYWCLRKNIILCNYSKMI